MALQDFSEAVRLRRLKLRISIITLAEMVGVSRQAVQGWESGKAFPGGVHTVKILSILGITADEAKRLIEETKMAEVNSP